MSAHAATSHWIKRALPLEFRLVLGGIVHALGEPLDRHGQRLVRPFYLLAMRTLDWPLTVPRIPIALRR